MTTRRALLVGAVTAPLVALAAPRAASAADYGSGTWGGLATRTVLSTDATWRAASVGMVGDSITCDTARHLQDTIRPPGTTDGPILAVTARASARTADGLDRLIDVVARGLPIPPTLIVALGSNDVFDPFVMPALIDRMLELVGPSTRVVWVTAQVCRSNYPAGVQLADQRNTGVVNAALHAALGRWPNLELADWAGFLAGNPGHRLTSYLRDGVHTTPDGTAARSAMLAARLT